MKMKYNQAVFIFLDLMLLMQASVDGLTLIRRPHNFPSIPIKITQYELRFEWLPNVQVNFEVEDQIGQWNLPLNP